MKDAVDKLEVLGKSGKPVPEEVMDNYYKLVANHDKMLELYQEAIKAVQLRRDKIILSLHPKQIPGTMAAAATVNRVRKKAAAYVEALCEPKEGTEQ